MARPAYYSSVVLTNVLTMASAEERLAITRILDEKANTAKDPLELQKEIGLCAGHGVSNWMRGGTGIGYLELLIDAAQTLKVEGVPSLYQAVHGELYLLALDRTSHGGAKDVPPITRMREVDKVVNRLERKVLSQLMVAAYEKATPAQRAEIDTKVAAMAKAHGGKDLAGLKTSAALIALGNLGGFATYTLMSTVLSAVSLGTLGFGAYTFASSLLSVVLGPVGWLGLAAYGAYKFGGANEAKVVRLAATCAMASQRQREGKDSSQLLLL